MNNKALRNFVEVDLYYLDLSYGLVAVSIGDEVD